MNKEHVFKKLAYWCVPDGIKNLISGKVKDKFLFKKNTNNSILQQNSIFKNIHYGERCFILGTGPSIKKQNLIQLKNEICFSLNLFYHYEYYKLISPKYHVYSGIVNHRQFINDELGLKFYKEIEENISSDYFFTHYEDFEFIKKHNLFTNSKLGYIDFQKRLDLIFCQGVDLTQSTFYVSNVAIQALLIAIYMGFSEIYLLGADHDWILECAEKTSGRYCYHKEKSVINVDSKYNWHEEVGFSGALELTALIWNQYKKIKRFCDGKNIRIYNATTGGLLDVFPRIEYEFLFKS